MKLADIKRRDTTKAERRKIRAEYNAWRRGDITIGGWTWGNWRQWAYKNQYRKCHYCRKKFDLAAMQVDHRVPVFYGGPNDLCNFILACRACNGYKAQHFLLRKNDDMAMILPKAKVVHGHRIDYKSQELAYAEAIHRMLDDEWMSAVARSE